MSLDPTRRELLAGVRPGSATSGTKSLAAVGAALATKRAAARRVLAAGGLSAGVAELVEAILAQDTAHLDALDRLTPGAGVPAGAPVPAPVSPAESLRELEDLARSAAEALDRALAAGGAPGEARLLAAIMAGCAQHAILLARALRPGDLAAALPAGLYGTSG